jgi:hypothetical protein
LPGVNYQNVLDEVVGRSTTPVIKTRYCAGLVGKSRKYARIDVSHVGA